MSLLVETYLNFESCDSLIDHLTFSSLHLTSDGYMLFPRTVSMASSLKNTMANAPMSLYILAVFAVELLIFLDMVEATLKSVRWTFHNIVQNMFEFVLEGALLNQEQCLINYIEESLEKSLQIAGPFVQSHQEIHLDG
ncbi:hypothetical protein BT96DRAFT_1005244 [Gymnopus androsaceus JB14]|uniref:Uncharacterized protein n=1 Tax=Gymnopus androsaceus JB14 TaxID=1447944 RepID=A0A6A4GPY5_9AGAR|nr:hypothetical protein BT96DRAFT_1005244 [Gymnopus androsaceus JB14]